MIVALAALLLCSCGGLDRGAPAPPTLSDQVTVLGLTNARFWADQGEALTAEGIAALERERAANGAGRDRTLPPAYFLAISGGGDDGAFGSGLLCGWSDAGTMPTFKLVTGVSTGAMIAPLVFLGRPYNDRLRALYTTIKPQDVSESRGLFGAVFGESLADTTPLFRLISRYVDAQMLSDIAREYNSGRLLLIGTTSLDEQRPIIWNIGAIAASGRPGSLELVRKILLASASVPGAFPPVMIDVEAGGRRYQEMNVDGGAVVQTFLYPPDVGQRVNLRSGQYARERHAYIIRNGRLDPDWASVDRRFLTIAGRAIATMIHYSGYNDILRIYATTKRDGVDYNLAYIDTDFPGTKHEDFDPAYLRVLFDYGYTRGRAGYPWRKAPPILETGPTATTRLQPPSYAYTQPQVQAQAYLQPQAPSYGYAQPYPPPSNTYAQSRPSSYASARPQVPSYAYAQPYLPSSTYAHSQASSYAHARPETPSQTYGQPQPTANTYARPLPPSYAYAQPQPPSRTYARPSYTYTQPQAHSYTYTQVPAAHAYAQPSPQAYAQPQTASPAYAQPAVPFYAYANLSRGPTQTPGLGHPGQSSTRTADRSLPPYAYPPNPVAAQAYEPQPSHRYSNSWPRYGYSG